MRLNSHTRIALLALGRLALDHAPKWLGRRRQLLSWNGGPAKAESALPPG